MNIELLEQAREMLEHLTPLKTNCGLLCGGACCDPDEDGQGGVLLFPGEAEILKEEEWMEILPSPMPVDGKDWGMMVCKGTCERKMRPLGCRIFPLTPVKTQSGAWKVRTDRRAWAMCPLMSSGIRGLDPEFVSTVKNVINLIAADPDCERFLEEWQDLEESYADSPFLL